MDRKYLTGLSNLSVDAFQWVMYNKNDVETFDATYHAAYKPQNDAQWPNQHLIRSLLRIAKKACHWLHASY